MEYVFTSTHYNYNIHCKKKNVIVDAQIKETI